METLPENLTDVTIEDHENETETEFESIFKTEEETETKQPETINIRAAQAVSVTFTDSDFIYTVRFNNSEYRVLFPENMRDYLVVRDGYLINMYGSTVTGLVLSSNDSAAIDSYHSLYLSLYPFTNTSGNNSAYNHNAYAYLTNYYPGGSYNTLSSSTTYGNVTVTQKPALFRGFSSFQLIMMFCAALLVLIQFFGGIFRR